MSATLLVELAAAMADGGIKVVDLTQPLEPTTPVLQLPEEYVQNPPFELHELSKYDERGPAWYWNWFKCGEHTGTHFDAPIHFITGKDYENNATDTIPVKKFIGPACVLDAVAEVEADPDFLITIEFVEQWEAKHGRIPKDSWVLFRSGWSKRLDPKEFLNFKEDGAHSPGWHPDVIPFLAEQRDILGAGVETVGTDAGQAHAFDPAFPCHTLMHGANKFGLASLTNLDQLPPTGAIIIAAPLKIVNGSGSPLRVLALIP
ncbi:MAG: cyclase [Robiginitomaculum sp.]|nr:MAG: cyclase [Robiginitomaculum sp.]